MIDPISLTVIGLGVTALQPLSSFVVGLLKYKKQRKSERAAQEEKEREAQAAAAKLMLEHIKLLEKMKVHQSGGWEALEKEYQQKKREREYQQKKEEQEKLLSKMKVQAEGWEALEKEYQQKKREREAKEEQERQEAREREAKTDEKVLEQAMLEKYNSLEAKLEAERLERICLEEKLEAERRDRIEGERNRTKEIESLKQTMENGIKLLLYLRQQLGYHHSSYNYQTLEYQELGKFLDYFELPRDSDRDLQNIFNASFIDYPCNPFDATESSQHLNCERDIEFDMSRLAMTTVNVVETRAKEEGNAYFKEQKFEMAIECYSKSIDELPTAAAYSNRAMAHIKLNKFVEAEQDCTDALNIDDRYFKAYARRAMARTKLGSNLEGALEDVQVALKFESNNMELKKLHYEILFLKEAKEKGNVLFKDKKFQEAIISYSVSINKSPTAVAYCNRAMVYLKLDKLMEAENDCTDALKIDNQYFKAYARRAIARSKFGRNFKGAFEDVEAALNLDPNNQEMKELHAKLNEVLG